MPSRMPQPSGVLAADPTSLLALEWDGAALKFDLTISLWLILILAGFVCFVFFWRWWAGGFTFQAFEIDQAEIGVGTGKFRFKPNLADRQVAYAIWVELSTRKIGLPIDFENDVIVDVYQSWYDFFAVTRDLIKSIPVIKVKRGSTQAIIKLSVEVLNEGLRPHLTKWQARFRRWYDRQLKQYDNVLDELSPDPQQIQTQFPQYEELKTDMQRVNEALIRYRRKMHELVLKD